MELMTLEKTKIHLNQNQEKVIKDKYLRGDKSAEDLFSRVAHNIALSEIIFHEKAQEWGIFDGVRCKITETENEGIKSRTILFHEGISESREREENFLKFLANLEKAYKNYTQAKDLVDAKETEFYNTMAKFDFLPNSPTLMNAGRELQQLSACYVLPVDDSMEAIAKSLTAQSLIQKSGGGTGFSFQRLRPKGDLVKKTNGVASGALSFMQLFDKMTDVVKQGGTRRGANMGILPYWHPEIEEFVNLKAKPGVMENFNISVALDAKFMNAAEKNETVDLINPRTKEPCGKLNAKKLFDQLVDSAWATGDPGIVFIDRINETNSNPTPHIGQIESTNPCGEQPLLPWESCNLGSINLAHFVKGEITKGEMDYKALGEAVKTAIRFLDNVIEINNYPLPEIEKIAKSNRKIGLGVMGWAETAVKLGVAYDSPKGIEKAREVMKFVQDKAFEHSCELANERGVFPNWKGSIYDAKSKYFRGTEAKPRNASRTTIAPTGTIAIAAGLQGSGIEPFFAIAYTRYNAKALEAIKNGKQPEAKDTFYEVNSLFKKLAEENNYFGMEEKTLWKKIEDNHKSVKGIKEIPAKIQELFPTAHDINYEYHVKAQAAFQEFTDNAVSKTINLPNKAKPEDVRNCYILSFKTGCKGITVYRDGCKAQQVLNISSGQEKQKKKKTLSFGASSQYYQIQTGYGPLHIHINYNENGPFQFFTNIPPLGTEISGLTALVGILLSKYLEAGGDPVKIIKHLNSVKGDRPWGFGENKVNSIPHAIAIALRDHLKKTGILTSDNESGENKLQLWEAAKVQYCPKCYSSNISFESGCSGPTCHDCGYSQCS
ncbi:MAG: adenosylcobalamin-dependent ribonucleoside-diphosphate reductase [Elusimicrobia bacterium]|nr:adenosylcobalamin-dependent ribonucleoside-diphosphate reductase [Elusimicrobiota bacterium]